jgi:peptide deformylase
MNITMNTIEDDNILKIDTNPYKTSPAINVEIETFELIEDTHPALHTYLQDFDFENPPVDPMKFASSLVETCKKHRGLGLSANQCGFYHRVFVMGQDDNYVAFFNPVLLSYSPSTIKMEEGCLSFRDLFLNIERPEQISVQYQDYTGAVKTATFSGLTARCFQHELDHMHGICYTNRIKPLALQMAHKKKQKLANQRRKVQKRLTTLVKDKFNANKF